MNEFEKKYKEALGWMRDVYPTLTGAAKEDAEHFFPELKDSEDERIRKDLISFLIDMKDGDVGCFPSQSLYQRWIAWLEKRKEQKPAEWSRGSMQELCG